MRKKFIATPANTDGGYIVERWNEVTGSYQKVLPQHGFYTEPQANEIAEFCNSLYEDDLNY